MLFWGFQNQHQALIPLQLTRDRVNAEISEEQRKAQEQEEINRQISDSLYGIYQNLADAQFQIAKNGRDADTSDQLRALNKQRENELKNKNLTEKEKEKIDADYDKKVAKIKLDAKICSLSFSTEYFTTVSSLRVQRMMPMVGLSSICSYRDWETDRKSVV